MIKFRDENDLQSSITDDYYDHENVVENRTRFTEWSKARKVIFENNRILRKSATVLKWTKRKQAKSSNDHNT